ncbi:MAG: Ig-like domain-containing protein, partial [Candidatus Thermoplasmatota archaeon]|nr:Ig-like domain-containing protein [Candidatus Thermoplasmatota archaeon]
TGELYGIPRNGDVGNHSFGIIIRDGTSFCHQDMTITVDNVNDPPFIQPIVTMIYWSEDSPFLLTPTAIDMDPTHDILYWSLLDHPDWMIVDTKSGDITGTPMNDDVGTFSVNISVSDGNGGYDTAWFNVSVSNINDNPVLDSVSPATLTEDEPWQMTLTFKDIDPTHDMGSWSVKETDMDFLSIDPHSGILSGTPGNDDVGKWFVTVKVDDEKGGSDSIRINITVLNVNDPPVILNGSIPNPVEDERYEVGLSAVDIDPTNDFLTWKIEGSDTDFLSIDTKIGSLMGTPTNNDVGTHWINVSVSDGIGGTSHSNFSFVVINVDDDPRIETSQLPDTIEDEHYSFFMNASDPDPDDDTLSWTMEHTEARFILLNRITGELSGTPGNDDVGSWSITINVSDGKGGYHSAKFILKVIGTNDPPTLNVSLLDISCKEDEFVTIKLKDIFLDIDMDQLTYEVAHSGNFSVKIIDDIASIEPVHDWSGSEIITFTARDFISFVAINATTTVTPVNDPPTNPIITSGQYRQGEKQVINGSATDPDLLFGDSLTFTWFSNISGRIGTGKSIDLALKAGSYLIILNVSDSNGLWIITSKEIIVLPQKEVATSLFEKINYIIIIIVGLSLLILILGSIFFVKGFSRPDVINNENTNLLKDSQTEVIPISTNTIIEPLNQGDKTDIFPLNYSEFSKNHPNIENDVQKSKELSIPSEIIEPDTAKNEYH